MIVRKLLILEHVHSQHFRCFLCVKALHMHVFESPVAFKLIEIIPISQSHCNIRVFGFNFFIIGIIQFRSVRSHCERKFTRNYVEKVWVLVILDGDLVSGFENLWR